MIINAKPYSHANNTMDLQSNDRTKLKSDQGRRRNILEDGAMTVISGGNRPKLLSISTG